MGFLQVALGRRWGLVVLVGGIAVVDLMTKQWAMAVLRGAPPVVVTPFLRWVYVENSGAAFGMFADGGEVGRWVLTGVALGLGAVLLFVMRTSRNAGERLACALMLGGALGNVVDRLRFGYVVDFVDAHAFGYHWPAFNVADMAICAGGAVFAAALARAFWRGR